MELWWCIECDAKVELNKHGQCGQCGSEGVYLFASEKDINSSFSISSETPEGPRPAANRNSETQTGF
jgi:hypothetical protein